MLTYSFSDRGELSLYEHLYRCIRSDIERGVVAAGEKLPSKRALARHLGVSLITVEGAYSQLMAEGYVRSEPRRGYYACDLGAAGLLHGAFGLHREEGHDSLGGRPVVRSGAAKAAPERARRAADAASVKGAVAPGGVADADGSLLGGAASEEAAHADAPLVADLTGGAVPLGLFPYGAWAKSMREALSCESEQALIGETEAAGSPRLRRVIADHLKGFRGMEVDPAQIVVGAGSQVLYNVLVQLLGRDLRYGVEDPGYPRLTSIYRANDVALSPIPLDGQGVDMRALERERVDVMHLMPSHQYPTGLVTSVGRRYELLAWANGAEERYLIEDDYDCEFRLAGRPIPALQSIDATGRVIYANTFAKSLGPAFRIGYVVLPERLAERFVDKLGFYSCTVSAIDQLALTRFIEGGDYERHVSRMRTHYRGVRDALLAGLRGCALADRLVVEQADAGIHFVMGVEAPAGHDAAVGERWDAAFVRSARVGGVAIRPLSAFYHAGEQACAGPLRRFLVSYGGLAPAAVEATATALSRAAQEADAEYQ